MGIPKYTPRWIHYKDFESKKKKNLRFKTRGTISFHLCIFENIQVFSPKDNTFSPYGRNKKLCMYFKKYRYYLININTIINYCTFHFYIKLIQYNINCYLSLMKNKYQLKLHAHMDR